MIYNIIITFKQILNRYSIVTAIFNFCDEVMHPSIEYIDRVTHAMVKICHSDGSVLSMSSKIASIPISAIIRTKCSWASSPN